MKFLIYILVLLAVSPCLAESTQIQKVIFPEEVRAEVRQDLDPDLEGLQWNRWTSQNFVVCSLNDQYAKFLHSHLESVKTWCLNRWGLQDVNFSAECIVLCIENKEMFKKFFGIEGTLVEVRRDPSGKLKRTVIFLLCDGPPAQIVPVPLMEVCLVEYEQQKGISFGYWAHRGMGNLNASLGDIRKMMGNLQGLVANDKEMFFSKPLLTATEDQLNQESNRKYTFDLNATAFCLMLRKEFGQDKFLKFLSMSKADPEGALKKVYGFDSFDQFNRSYKRFMFDLSSDIAGTRPGRPVTPDDYLQIREKTLTD